MKPKEKQNPRAVVIGGSFAGINAAATLKRIEPGFDVTVIDKDDCFTMMPALYETAARGDSNEEICIPTARIAKRHGFDFFHDEATFINWRKKFVDTRNGERIHYDYILIAVGAQTNYYSVEGVGAHALNLKRRQDADRISEKLKLLLAKKKPLSIAVCGGGMSGIQFTAELGDWLKSVGAHQVKLFHTAPRLAQELPEDFSALAKASLEKKGVTVHLSTPIAKITKKGIETVGGEKHDADVVLWCGGNNPPEFLAKTGLPTEKGYLAANEFLQSPGSPQVFAAGDCAAVNTADGKTAYQTVWNAVLEGKLAAKNISRHYRGKPMQAFSTASVPIIFTLGRNYGVLLYKGFMLEGRVVAMLKRFVERFYLSAL